MRGGVDGTELAKTAVGIVIKMIFEDGFFHADPHPGNIIILEDRRASPSSGSSISAWSGASRPSSATRPCDLMVAAVRKDTSPSPTRSTPSAGRPRRSTCPPSAPRSRCSRRSTSVAR